MKAIKTGWFFTLMLTMATHAFALQPFEQVAEDIVEQYRRSVAEQKLTKEKIQNRRDYLQLTIQKLKSRLAVEENGLEADHAALAGLAQQRDAIKKEISSQLTQKEELDALFMDHARGFLARAEKSPYSAENSERLEILKDYISKDWVFGLKDLNNLLDLYFQDLDESGRKIMYSGEVIDRGGNEVTGQIIRMGHMGALHRSLSETGYLTLSPASGHLIMSAPPPYFVKRNLSAYFDGKTDDVFFDVSGGVAIQQLGRRVGLVDQLRSGGILVIPILLVGLVACLLTLERLFFLGRVRHNTDALMTRVTELVARGDFDAAVKTAGHHEKRPTGRVLMAGLKHRGQSGEVVESALSEAILKETPRLERFLGALKVSAAVAPLLGLLGTVTGMINTFQVITTHGTGDPRLMAGGISEAMVTTQVGLAVAIPIMIITAFLKRRAHTLAQDMEEKGLALMGALLSLNNNGNH